MNTATSPAGRLMRRGRPRRAAAIASVAVGASTLGLFVGGASAGAAYATPAAASPQGSLSSLQDVTVASVVAPNGDANPYGIAVVPKTIGKLTAGNLLVVDFNNAAGAAGQGTSVLQVNPTTGATSLFYAGAPATGPVGVAINPLNDGVWIGAYGTAPDGTTGDDLLIGPDGALKATFNATTTKGATNFTGVWGQGVSDANGVSFYWGNAGNATTGGGGGDVWRLTPHPTASSPNGQPVNSTYAQIATGQGETPAGGNAATAAGPQGFAFDQASGTLYETNDADNTLYAIPSAATATGPQPTRVVLRGGALNVPENVVIDPANGDLLVANAGNNTLTEVTPAGQVVATRNLAPGQAPGALFGLATGTDAQGNTVIYYVNDNTNTVHALTVAPPANGYRIIGNDGSVFAYGAAAYDGGANTTPHKAAIVGTATRQAGGYWLAAADGTVTAFGGAPTFPSAVSHLTAPVVGIAATPDGGGYWLVASDGGVFSYGDAAFHGSAGAIRHLAAPVVGIAATPDGGGYQLVAADGGVFTYGDAGFYGSTGGIHLAAPVVGMAATPDGAGYHLVAADGGVFSFGDASFYGSTGGIHLAAPVVGIAATPDGAGYDLVAADGGVFTYGDAPFAGSAAGTVHARAAGIAITY